MINCQNTAFNNKVKKVNKNLLGQSAPSDMIFIKGENATSSYYISICEEPNINYITYLHWLNDVFFPDYPNVITEALPHKDNGGRISSISDPYYSAYFTNPLYAYYPVVNLDFLQIQKYLAWKTDRLNEAILIKNGYLKENYNQVNEDHFNTETYINGQYGYQRVSDDICGLPTKDRALLGDGTFFMGYRLPTEKEWNLANQAQYNNEKLKREKSLFSKKLNFGDDYFLKFWQNHYQDNRDVHFENQPLGQNLRQYYFDLKQLEENKIEIENPDSGYISIMNYRSNSYGVINMEGGVKEIVLDTYSKFLNQDRWLKTMNRSNFNTQNVKQYDNEGYEIAKDSLGYMSYRYLGIDHNGAPIPVAYAPVNITINRLVLGGTVDEPSAKRDSLPDGEFSNKIGFRCILPYTGAPIRKGYKVKW